MGESQPESTAVQAELAVRGVLVPGKVLRRGPRLHTPVGGPYDLKHASPTKLGVPTARRNMHRSLTS